MKLTTRQESDFIAASRLLMICGLVYHHLFEIPGSDHSPRLSMEQAEVFVPEFINGFFHMAMMAAVPTLSVISGFLFFNRREIDFRKLLKGRFHSVAVPSWLWCALWLCLGYGLYQLYVTNGWFRWTASYGFDSPTPMTIVNGIFGLTREPFAFQFWFVRDLILMLILTPILYYFLRLLGHWLLIPVLGLWLLLPDPPLFFSGNVPVFFTIGALLAMPGGMGLQAVLEKLAAYRAILLILFAVLLVVRLMSYAFGAAEAFIQGHIYLCLLRVTGVAAFSSLLYPATLRDSPFIRTCVSYSGYSFFIFATHFPLIELLQDAVTAVPGYDTAAGMFLSWLLIPLLTIGLSLLLAMGLERSAPGWFHTLNGGRQGEHRQANFQAHPL